MNSRIIIALAVLLGLIGGLFASDVFECVSQRDEEIIIDFSLPELVIETEEIENQTYSKIISRQGYTVSPGLPELPVYSSLLAIADKGAFDVEIADAVYREIKIDPVYPSQGVDLKNENRSFRFNRDFYEGDKSFPLKNAKLGNPAIMRDVRTASLSVFPFSYNPETRILRYAESMQLKVIRTADAGENEILEKRKISRSFEKIYKTSLLNYDNYREDVPEYQQRSILIVYDDETSIQTSVNWLKNWKKQKGFYVEAVSTSETGYTSSAVKTYIENAYETWENPVEYIILIGDAGSSDQIKVPTWTEDWSFYHGEGDQPYTYLAGNDYIGDAFIGRLSVNSSSQLTTMMAKISLIEKTPVTSDLSIYGNSLLVADTSPSGISCIMTSEYVKAQILSLNPSHQFTELYGGNPSAAAMNNALNAGAMIFNYRGWIGMSGWDQSYISQLNNTNKLFNAVILTCSTGSFANSTSNTEAVVRKGSPGTPQGAYASVGMATSGTHTRYNNILDGGIIHGMFAKGLRNMGEAVYSGETELYNAYANSDFEHYQIFAHWCNLIGDPSMDFYLKNPESFNIAKSYVAEKGLELRVADVNGTGIKDAWVTFYSAGADVQVSAYTDETGRAVLNYDATSISDAKLTITKPDYVPYIEDIIFDDIFVSEIGIDDDNAGNSQGNGNQAANPGERIELYFNIENNSNTDMSDITASLTSDDSYAEINTAEAAWVDINSGNSGSNQTPFVITISPAVEDRYQIPLSLSLSYNGSSEETVNYSLEINGNDLDPVSYSVPDEDNAIYPGDAVNFKITLKNNGRTALNDVYGILESRHSSLSIGDTLAAWGNIGIGQEAECSVNDFTLNAASNIVPGSEVELALNLYNEDGYSESETLTLVIGGASAYTPTGPDAFGYICLDESDTAYEGFPVYDWIEIDPSEGGNGVDTGISDNFDEADDLHHMDLPFEFKFYGEFYSDITICSNGFITFGETEQAQFRNWNIPGALGPSPMIAAFWDDLITSNGGVYTEYYNNEAFIIEWSKNKNHNGNALETFQIILYNPAVVSTPTGDGLIKLQYKEFNNVDSSSDHANYATVGIEDHTGLVGIEYTYDNEYPVTAQTLTDETALIFKALPSVYYEPYLVIEKSALNGMLSQNIYKGETYELGLYLSNLGEEAANNVSAEISCENQGIYISQSQSDFSNIGGHGSSVNQSPYIFSVGEYTANDVVTFTVNVTSDEDSWAYPVTFSVMNPSLEHGSMMISDPEGNNDGVPDPNEDVVFVLSLTNPYDVPAEGVEVEVTAENDFFTVNSVDFDLDEIPGNSNIQIPVRATLGDAEEGQTGGLKLTYSDDSNDPKEKIYYFTVSTTGYDWDFETEEEVFSAYGAWQRGNNGDAHSGSNIWATVLNGNYANGANYRLESPEFYLPGNSTLSFWHKYHIENGMQTYDGGNVKISTDGGISWSIIVPEGGYPEESCSSGNYAIPGEPCYSGDLYQWTEAVFDLSPYGGNDVKLRWHFGSDSGVSDDGWFIDDVTVACEVFPCGKISGTVTGAEDMSAVRISTGDYTAYPGEDGNYDLYVREGVYNPVCSAPSYTTETIENVAVEYGESVENADFDLEYLSPVENLALNSEYQHISLTWDFDASRKGGETVATRNGRFSKRTSFNEYIVYMQIGAGLFEELARTQDESFAYTAPGLGTYRFKVTASFEEGESDESNTVEAVVTELTEKDDDIVHFENDLLPNWPNPFNPETNIAFTLEKEQNVSIKIYNIKGELVKIAVKGKFSSGRHSAVWKGDNENGKKIGSGVYFIRMKTDSFVKTGKALLLK